MSRRIDFGQGNRWAAVSTDHLASVATSGASVYAMRVYLLALSRLTPRGSADFDAGELAALLGVHRTHASRAMREAKAAGLVHDQSTVRRVWVYDDHAQVGFR